MIRAVCPTCREVDVAVGEARLDVVDWIEDAVCHLTCPGCAALLRKPVPPPLMQILIRMGVPYQHPDGPPSPPPPPLGPEDVARFRDFIAGL